jgi:predicted deacetylase
VSPASADALERALDLCHAAGATPALLVVPNFHGLWPLDRYPRFAERLRELHQAGHELLLHGFYHQANQGRGARAFVAQRMMSNGEAEFAAIDRAEAESRVDDGLALLASMGLRPSGFVAPAWQMMRWLLPVLAARGLAYAEDHVRVYDPVAGTSRPSLVLNFASRTPARLWSSAAFVRLAAPMRGIVVTRIALHPNDLAHPVLVRETQRTLALARGTFTATTRDLVA